ncbi:MAG TPA: RNA pseudouridine synthase [Saprospiraceae bacterium]|nr:RNA pseudouridine synthase [Saprospiraceae bacterium]
MNIQVIQENEDWIAVNKPAGMAVQNDPNEDFSLLQWVEEYCQTSLHLINRLDRPVSGVVLFAKKVRAYHNFMNEWANNVQKKYIAVTEGKWKNTQGLLDNKIIKGRNNKAILSDFGKNALIQYKVLKELDHYTILEVILITGRFHQIRLQLSLAGHPVKGDVKYGARRRNQSRHIHLHCYSIQIRDQVKIMAPLPHEDALWSLVNRLIH